MADLYVMGDVHGHLVPLVGLLHGVGLINPDHLGTAAPAWTGGTATLWFMGDFTDRGPNGVGVIDLVMRLQREAAAVGGRVQSLLGNHEMLLVAATRFGGYVGAGGSILDEWQRNGGQAADLAQLTARHIAWIGGLPALARVGNRLLIHADSLLYLRYGSSLAEVNAAFAGALAGDDPAALYRLLGEFADRGAFIGETGVATARAILTLYGGRQIVHGHTPITTQTGQPPATVAAPLVYAGGLCVNVDPGLYRGGPGFVTRLLPLDAV